jgi:hypothetical protein
MTQEEDEKLTEAIHKKEFDEICYWVNEHLNAYESNNISIHKIKIDEGTRFHIINDMNSNDGVLIRTRDYAETVKESHQYMMLDTEVFKKISELYIQNKEYKLKKL